MAQAAETLIPETIGERLRFIRERRGLTQIQVSEATGKLGVKIHPTILARFERWGSSDPNARRPSFAHLCALAIALNVKLSQLGATEQDYPELRFVRDPAMLK